eukprot:jgi/Mesvir1/19108/Mv12853-RA.1
MDSLPAVDQLFAEYLLFRGFTATLASFESERRSDATDGLRVDRMVELLLGGGLRQHDAASFLSALSLVDRLVLARVPADMRAPARQMLTCLKRHFLVSAHVAGRADAVREFFVRDGDNLAAAPAEEDWGPWFALPYRSNPASVPQFRPYFSREWLAALSASLRNLLAAALARMELPAVLRFDTDRHARMSLQRQVEALQAEAQALRAQLQEREARAAGVSGDGLGAAGGGSQGVEGVPVAAATTGEGDRGGAARAPASDRRSGDEKQLLVSVPPPARSPMSTADRPCGAATTGLGLSSSHQSLGSSPLPTPSQPMTPQQTTLQPPPQHTREQASSKKVEAKVVESKGGQGSVTPRSAGGAEEAVQGLARGRHVEAPQRGPADIPGSMGAELGEEAAWWMGPPPGRARVAAPPLVPKSQEAFLGHADTVTRCRFCPDGNGVASGSADGTVRIWTPDTNLASSRNASIYCSAPLLALEWEYRSRTSSLLLLGTAQRSIKAWDVDSKRVVCSLMSEPELPRVVAIASNPADATFVTATASAPASKDAHAHASSVGASGAQGGDEKRPGAHGMVDAAAAHRRGTGPVFVPAGTDAVGALHVWDLKQGQVVQQLSLDGGSRHHHRALLSSSPSAGASLLTHDVAVVNSLSFNHNGKILATAASDGMLRLFDLNSGTAIMGWPAAHAPPGSLAAGEGSARRPAPWRCMGAWAVQYAPDQNSVFSLAADGYVVEWSLHGQRQALRMLDATAYCCADAGGAAGDVVDASSGDSSCRGTGMEHVMRGRPHEMALDATGKRLLVTSISGAAPLFSLQNSAFSLAALDESGALAAPVYPVHEVQGHNQGVTSVHWHPTKPVCLTGSADRAVRVTTLP